MAKYLFEASHTAEGVKGLLKEGGTSRRAAIKQLVKGVGGSVEVFYYAFGKTDAYVVVDLPDDVSATAVSLAVNASGVVTVKTTPLIEPEEVDEATTKTVDYRPPGR